MQRLCGRNTENLLQSFAKLEVLFCFSFLPLFMIESHFSQRWLAVPAVAVSQGRLRLWRQRGSVQRPFANTWDAVGLWSSKVRGVTTSPPKPSQLCPAPAAHRAQL